jgi:hypothetical protein
VGARDGHGAVFDRLAQHLEYIARILGKLVEEQHSVVGQADFARPRHAGAAADQASVGDGVVGRAEGTLAHQSAAAFEDAGDAVDFGGFDSLFECERRQNTGEPFREHRLARTGWPDHKHVVTNIGL